MPSSQRPYSDKTGLGFENEVDEKSSKDSQNKIPTCIHCFKNRHSFEKCFSKRKAKKHNVKKPKKITNPKGPKKIWVPKVKIVFDAGVS